MKNLVIFILLFTSIYSFSQKKLKYIDPAETIKSAMSFYSSNEFEEAINEVNELSPNDSVYMYSLVIKADVLLSLEKYDEVIAICKDKIHPKTIYTSDFYLYKGLAELRKDDFDISVNTFKEYIADYPKSYLAYYNMGICYENLEKYDLAIETFQEVIKLNPYYADPHLRLGLLCAAEGLISQAILCFNTFLFISPSSDNALGLLSYMNDIVANKQDLKSKGITISVDDKAFEEIDLIVNNYAALSRKYKIPLKIKEPIIKQNHAIMEKLAEFEGNDGLWANLYVPFYKELFQKGYFSGFSYRIMKSTTNSKYQKLIKKYRAEQEDAVKWGADRLAELIGTDRTKDSDGNLLSYFYYNTGKLYCIGNKKDDGSFDGYCQFFTEKGDTLATGSYKNSEKDGLWRWFNDVGKIKETAVYDSTKLNGPDKTYYHNGQLASFGTQINSLYGGNLYKYNKYGALASITEVKEGKSNGIDSIFFNLGKDYLKFTIPYTDDLINGKAIRYYASGEKKLEIDFIDGKRKHEFAYFRNGQIKNEYNYIEGKFDGDYKLYFETGELSEKGQFIDDNKTGEWLSYFIDGTLFSKKYFDEKGRLNGLYAEYGRDGKLYYEFTYRKDDVISYKYYDKKGNVIKEAKKKQGKFFYEGHYQNGVISTEGNYLLDGGKDGSWKYYNEYGYLISVEDYDEGVLSGEDNAYFTNAKISSMTNYVEGKADGYSFSNFSNGSKYRESYYVDDMKERIWRYYYIDGTTSVEEFYFHDKLSGDQEFYSETGKLSYINYFEDGNHLKSTYYDTLGNVFEVVDYYNPEKYDRHYHNGNINEKRNYLYGILHGDYTAYYFNGKVSFSGQYFNTNKHGQWKWYNDKGQLIREGEYYYGQPIGSWNYYHDNGTLKEIRKFKDGMIEGEDLTYNDRGILVNKETYFKDKRHGPTYWYGEKGDLQIVRYYNYGILTGYSYDGTDGKLVPVIPIEKGTAKLICYYKNGQESRDFKFVNGKIHGLYKEYHINGQLESKVKYEYGKREGKRLVYYENGQLKEVGHFLGNNNHGKFINYYENGKTKSILYYLNDKPTGTGQFYNEEGKITKVVHYFDGEEYDVEYL